jgi:hypothetical protein
VTASSEPSEWALDDFDIHSGKGLCHSSLELWSLIATIGIELKKEGVQTEQGCHYQHATIATGYIGGMDKRMYQEALSVDENMPLLACIIARRIDDGRGWRGLMASLFPTGHVKGLVNAVQCPVLCPEIEIVVERAPWR